VPLFHFAVDDRWYLAIELAQNKHSGSAEVAAGICGYNIRQTIVRKCDATGTPSLVRRKWRHAAPYGVRPPA
jgi:hypothetical protein